MLCPCCKYDTLSERSRYDICYICNWEDGGQNDPWADEIEGGPNSDYSLTEARFNFQKYYTMYRPSDSAFLRNYSTQIIEKKRKLMALLDEKQSKDEKNPELNAKIKTAKEELDKTENQLRASMNGKYNSGIINQPPAIAESRKWTQMLINQHEDQMNTLIKEKIHVDESEKIQWLSPLASDHYSEYFGQGYLDLLGLETQEKLSDFIPRLHFPWSAIGRSSSGKIILVDAKSKIDEFVSYGANLDRWEDSKELILKSLNSTKKYFMYGGTGDWLNRFHQYSLRLMNLYWLKVVNELDVYVVFLNYLNDEKGVATVDEWEASYDLVHSYFGLNSWGRHRLEKFAPRIYIDINNLTDKKDIHTSEYTPPRLSEVTVEEIELWLEFVDTHQNIIKYSDNEEKQNALRRISANLNQFKRKRYGLTE